ncbi:hypothetical protein VPH35_123992 [Triticum aestivum]|uniref:Uncharacterized protein n=2 Tax=Triticum TaxID=4564 RepID=A0A3B6RHG4_WHEAT|nr:uncharacterized protein At5g41620-like [Triticum aestivum]
MEVEPPPPAAAGAAVPRKCGVGGEQPGHGTPNRPREAQEDQAAPAPLRRELAAARARRRAGRATPSPSWKLEASPPRPEEPPADAAAAGRRSSSGASARQLGATLWEIQDVVRAAGAGRRIRRRARRGPAASPHRGGDDDDDVDRPHISGGCGRDLSAPLMEHEKLHEDRCHSRQSLSPASYTSSIGAATINLVSPTRSLNFRDRYRDAGCNLKTSTELLKVLNRIWSLEEQHAVDVSAVKGLKSELQNTQARVQELTQERQRYHYEIESLARQVTEDKMARKNKEQEKLRATLCSLQEELEAERHLRKHSENLHRKLGKELSAMKPAFLKAVKDLEKEQKATRLLEDLCDEFALGIRNYEEEVRVLKQRHVKEYEQKTDKLVVHISEAWLDERIQMQNADARGDSEGKTSITERLSGEIRSFLHGRRSSNFYGVNKHAGNEKGDASLCRQSLESLHLNGATSAPRLAEDDENSVASDLHCFELNMHGDAVQTHDLAGTRRTVADCMYSPMRRLEFSDGLSVEGSRISSARPCSEKGKVKPRSSKAQLNTSAPEISSRNGDKIDPIDEQNETVMTQVSRRLHDDLLKIKSEAPQHAFLERKPHDHHPRTYQFRECAASSSDLLHNLHSPARQLKNHQRAPLDYQTSECTTTGDLRGLRSPSWQLKNQRASLDYQISECATTGDMHNLRSPSWQLKNHHRSSLDHEISESSPARSLGSKDNTLKAKLLQARLEGQHARIRASGYPLISTRR